MRDSKQNAAFEVFVVLGVIALLCFVTRIWPAIFLALIGLIVAALVLLFRSGKSQKRPAARGDAAEHGEESPTPPRPSNEQDAIRVAFGVLQRRVNEAVTGRYPAARWVWAIPNAMEYFAVGAQLAITLNRAGGFRKAFVQTYNLQFRGLTYETAPAIPSEPPFDADDYYSEDDTRAVDADGTDDDANGGEGGTDDDEADAAPSGDNPGAHASVVDAERTDYSILAFTWVETNLSRLNELSNNAIAAGEDSITIPADMLPDRDSWGDICAELTRNGFAGAISVCDGDSGGGVIAVLPQS